MTRSSLVAPNTIVPHFLIFLERITTFFNDDFSVDSQRKAFLPSCVTVLGMVISSSVVQLNASLPIFFTPSLMVAFCSFLQFANARSPIFLILPGIVINYTDVSLNIP